MAYTGHVMGTRIETDMRRDAYAHLQKLSNTYYNNTKVGQIMGRITNDLFDRDEADDHRQHQLTDRRQSCTEQINDHDLPVFLIIRQKASEQFARYIQGMKTEMKGMKADLWDLRFDVKNLQLDSKEVKNKVTKMELTVENEIRVCF